MSDGDGSVISDSAGSGASTQDGAILVDMIMLSIPESITTDHDRLATAQQESLLRIPETMQPFVRRHCSDS